MIIKLFENFKYTKREIEQYLHKLDLLHGWISRYTINSDLTVDIHGDIDLRNKDLCELPFKFGKVDGDFYVSDNQLKNFDGFPKEVGRMLCGDNEFESLNGCTNIIRGDFNCSDCKLTSLENGPQIVDGYYSFARNLISNFKGFPKGFKKNVFCGGNPVSEVIDIFLNTPPQVVESNKSNVGGTYGELIDIINEYEIIDGDTINWILVEMIFYEYSPKIGLNPIKGKYLKHWFKDEIPNPNELELKNFLISLKERRLKILRIKYHMRMRLKKYVIYIR